MLWNYARTAKGASVLGVEACSPPMHYFCAHLKRGRIAIREGKSALQETSTLRNVNEILRVHTYAHHEGSTPISTTVMYGQLSLGHGRVSTQRVLNAHVTASAKRQRPSAPKGAQCTSALWIAGEAGGINVNCWRTKTQATSKTAMGEAEW